MQSRIFVEMIVEAQRAVEIVGIVVDRPEAGGRKVRQRAGVGELALRAVEGCDLVFARPITALGEQREFERPGAFLRDQVDHSTNRLRPVERAAGAAYDLDLLETAGGNP